MDNSLDFLIKTSKLKEIPRTGWVLRKVKNPETISEHTFRMAFAVWLLGKKEHLNIKRLIRLAVIHDLCEVYAGDNTPFFYYQNLKKNNATTREKFLKWVRLSQKEKEEMGNKKFLIEKQSIIKLTKSLEPTLRREIVSGWLDFENKFSKEGKFVRQVDRVETLLQAIEYFGIKKNTAGTAWWEEIEEVIEDPMLLRLLKIIQNKFYGKHFPADKNLENILDFLVDIGRLKRMPRLYWKLRRVKNPETVADHIFTLMLMVLVFGRQKHQLNMEKLLKMALCHEITAVYTHDSTPYGSDLPKNKKELDNLLKRIPRLSAKDKTKQFLKDYQSENRALLKLVSKLEPSFRKEIIQLWKEYRMRESSEARFLGQLNVLAVLLQAILYRKKKNKFSISALWELVFEICDDPISLALIDEMKKKL
jgi:putative hydrolases of HD superfamily